MKYILLGSLILISYVIQADSQQFFYGNVNPSIYYNAQYANKRNILPNYRQPYSILTNIHGPSNLASFAYKPQPPIPQWAVIYNRLANERRQQIDATRRMMSQNHPPISTMNIKNSYQSSYPRTGYPDRRMQVQNNKQSKINSPQKNNYLVKNNKLDIKNINAALQRKQPLANVKNSNKQPINRLLPRISQGRNPVAPLANSYPFNTQSKQFTKNPIASIHPFTIPGNQHTLSYTAKQKPLIPSINLNNKQTFAQKQQINKLPQKLQTVPKSLSYLKKPSTSKIEETLMSMPTNLIFLQKKARDNIYLRGNSPFINRKPIPRTLPMSGDLIHRNPIGFYKNAKGNSPNTKKSLIASSIEKQKFKLNASQNLYYPFNSNNALINYFSNNNTSGINSSWKHGWKRHRVFHPSFHDYDGDKRRWIYRRYHVYHQNEPKSIKNTKRENLLIPVAFAENAIDDDDNDDVDYINNGGDVSFMEDSLDENNGEDLPYVKPHLKIPIVNIETPNMNGLPEKIKQQIEATAQPVYKIINGNVKAFKEIHEPLIPIAPLHKIYKDVDSVRKSFVGDDSLFNDYVPNENELPPRRMPSDKSKMSEEELEAFKEDQAANSLIKDGEKSKPEEPELIGFDKQGLSSPTDKNLLESHIGAQPMVDNTVAGDTVDSLTNKIDHAPPAEMMHQHFKAETNKFADSAETGMHKAFVSRHSSHKGSSSTFESRTSRDKKKQSGGLVDKNKISDSGNDMDYRHPVSEIDAIENLEKDKFNDYEQYGNNRENEDQLSARDEMDMSDRFPNMDHSDERPGNRGENSDGMKPIEYTMKQGEENVDEAIRKLESSDSFDPDKLPSLMDDVGKKHFHRDDPEKLPPLMDNVGKKHFHRDRESDEDQDRDPEHLPHSRNHQREMYSHEDRDDQREPVSRKSRHRETPEHVRNHENYEHEQPSSRFQEQMPMSEGSMDDPGSSASPLKPGMSLDDVLDPEKAEERASHLSEQFELSKKMDKGLPMDKDIALDKGVTMDKPSFMEKGAALDKGVDPENIKAAPLENEASLNQGVQNDLPKRMNENAMSSIIKPQNSLPDGQMVSKQNFIDNPQPPSLLEKAQPITDEMIPRNYPQKFKEQTELLKATKDTQGNNIKVAELSPEDAIHALNNKKSLNDILANIKDEEHYGPPDAVVNAQFDKNAIQANQTTLATTFIAPNYIDNNPLQKNKTEPIASNDFPKTNTSVIDPLTNLENVLKSVGRVQSSFQPSTTVSPSLSNKTLANMNSDEQNNSKPTTSKKDMDTPNDLQISEIQNATVTKEVVSILESLGQLRPASNLTVPIENIGNNPNSSPAPKNKDQINTTKSIVRDINPNNNSPTTKVPATFNASNNSTSDNTTEDIEEKETKEAVHDLNIAISILEKKLSLISAAKKSGNKKAIYIVDETLRNSKPVTKSFIATHKNTSKESIKNNTFNGAISFATNRHIIKPMIKHRHLQRHKAREFPIVNFGKRKNHFKKSKRKKHGNKIKRNKHRLTSSHRFNKRLIENSKQLEKVRSAVL